MMKKNQNKTVNISMLKKLEPKIFYMLNNPQLWQTLDIDYFPPRVERLYANLEGYRLYLHIIHHTKQKCLYHKHRWPAAFKMLNGHYEMGLTYSPEEITSAKAHKLPDIAKFVIAPGCYYEMTQTDTLHYVKPLSKCSWSIMLTKEKYPASLFRKEKVHKKLKLLSDTRKLEILDQFIYCFYQA